MRRIAGRTARFGGPTGSSAPAGPAPLAFRPGAAADLLRVPAADADRAGAVRRSHRSAAETAALLALMQGGRPG